MMSKDIREKILEVLLSFYNGVDGNTDIKPGHPPIHMHEARERLLALFNDMCLEARVGELNEWIGGSKYQAFSSLADIRASMEVRLAKLQAQRQGERNE